MQLLYDIAAIIVGILIIPVFLIRAIRERGFVERIKQCLGFVPAEDLERVAKKNCIWVHAASVGEVVATSPLIKEFRKEFPKNPILVSVVTTNGYEMANRIIKDADSIIYFPLDLPFIAANMVRRIAPRVFLPVETELWPNFLRACRNHKIPVMMVNGRISDKSVKRYHLLYSLLNNMINTVTKFAMQSPIDAEYIIRLGANPNLVIVTGNTKFDQTYTDVTEEEKQSLLQEMGLQNNDGIFLAGSTHRGEEEFVLKAFEVVRQKRPNAKLVIAPRELLRVREVLAICKHHDFPVKRRTELLQEFKEGKQDTSHDIVILDTIGELGKVYSIGDVIYVGGSLISHGGHNILEPAAHGKAIVVGYNMFNFKETHALFTKRNAVVTVQDAAELSKVVAHLFEDEEERHRMEHESKQICLENKGAARKSAVLLHQMIVQVEEGRLASGFIKSTNKVENFQTYFYHLIHSHDAHGFLTQLGIAFLFVCSIIYTGLVKLKLNIYRLNLLKKSKLPCYVISLGNITVGGTGKTPTAQQLALFIRSLGYRVVILNHGYRAKWKGAVGIVSDGKKLMMNVEEAGDEAYMLAKHLPDIPVLIGPERSVTGAYAVKNFQAEVAILDDGYQHWDLIRDLDILLIDAVNVFGNGYLLPRGTLREPISNIDRADVCLLTKVDQANETSREYIHTMIRKKNKNALIVESIHRPICFVKLSDWHQNIASKGVDVSEIKGTRVMAVSAIGNPSSFEQTLADLGAIVVESLRFPDHHEYTVQEMIDSLNLAIQMEAQAIVVTEKDAVKIPMYANIDPSLASTLPIYVVSIEVQFETGGDELKKLIEDNLKTWRERKSS